jgi:mRNA-degrading endonuclease RelE of RelBE toxin-antitoxin system
LWQFEYAPKFIRQYKKLSGVLQSMVKLALTHLAHSDNPLKLGTYKKHLKAFAYDLDKSNRILYNVRFPDNIIELLRVGDHKETYGTD